MAELRKYKMWWSRVGALGILAVPVGVNVAGNGHPLAAVLIAIAGVSWVAVAAVFLFEYREAIAAVLQVICGASVAALGLAFHDEKVLPGLIAVCAGVALAGGGVFLLNSSGVLPRLRNWLTYLIRPASPP